MIVALAYCPQDQVQAAKLLGWMQELGPYPSHELLLFRERKSTPIQDAGKGFGKFTEQVFDDPYRKWPISTTNAFATAARYVEHTCKEQQFLWLEPDVVPMRKGWLDELEAEYKRTPKKPFLGAMVPGIGGTPDHMSGVAIWPGEMTKYAGLALMLDEDAPFDITACEIIYPQAHFTDKIQHIWDRPAKNLTGEERMTQITSECVLFHGDKSGALIDYLRAGKPTVQQEAPPLQRIPAEGERAGDLVFKNGGWRKEALPVSVVDKPDGTQGLVPKTNLDGTANNGQPEKIDTSTSPEPVPVAPSKTLQFGSDELQAEVALKKPLPLPWKDKKASEKEIRLLAETLSLFCTAPTRTHFVRKTLQEAGVTK